MDSGQLIFILSRLILNAAASFLAIMLWSRTRDAAWILIIVGTIMAYADIVYSILNRFGIYSDTRLVIGSVSLVSILLPCLQAVFFIAALMVMVVRKYRRR